MITLDGVADNLVRSGFGVTIASTADEARSRIASLVRGFATVGLRWDHRWSERRIKRIQENYVRVSAGPHT